jgi:hypothetical protein
MVEWHGSDAAGGYTSALKAGKSRLISLSSEDAAGKMPARRLRCPCGTGKATRNCSIKCGMQFGRKLFSLRTEQSYTDRSDASRNCVGRLKRRSSWWTFLRLRFADRMFQKPS